MKLYTIQISIQNNVTQRQRLNFLILKNVYGGATWGCIQRRLRL